MVSRLTLCCLLLAGAAFAQKRDVTGAEVMKVHRSAILIDTHNDVTSDTVKGIDISARRTTGHTDVPRLQEGGVGAVFFAAYVSAEYLKGNRAAHRALEMIDTVRHDIVGRSPTALRLALSAADIEAARQQGRIAALIGIEGGHAIEDNLRLLRSFYALGIRYMTLTHSNTNNWADSSGDLDKAGVKHHNGLTDFGRSVVREMNRIGMMVDISHVADKTFWDALAVSSAPIFASHSSCRALSNIPRNMTDEMIVALAKKGGVVQVNFGCEFLSQASADASPSTNKEYARRLSALPLAEEKKLRADLRARQPKATLADAVAHIDHIVKIAGIDSVGIGSDYDGVGCVPVGLEDVTKFPSLTRALLEHGYKAEDIRKIYGGNLLRVMRAVEKSASRSN